MFFMWSEDVEQIKLRNKAMSKHEPVQNNDFYWIEGCRKQFHTEVNVSGHKRMWYVQLQQEVKHWPN